MPAMTVMPITGSSTSATSLAVRKMPAAALVRKSPITESCAAWLNSTTILSTSRLKDAQR